MIIKKKWIPILLILLIVRCLLKNSEYKLIMESMYLMVDIAIVIGIKLVIRIKNSILNVIYYILVILFILGSIFGSLFSVPSSNTYITSPNKTHTMIVSEHQMLAAATYIYIYEKKNFLFKEKLPIELSTGDASLPFKGENYRVEWKSEDEFTLSCPYRRGMEPWDYVTHKFE